MFHLGVNERNRKLKGAIKNGQSREKIETTRPYNIYIGRVARMAE